jgi:hypothetical protein
MGATGLLWLDRAEELKPNEIKLSGSIVDGASSVTVVWHIEPNRMLRWNRRMTESRSSAMEYF